MSKASSLARLAHTLALLPRWRILVHEKPDGDALGGGSALVCWGKTLGKDVSWGGPDPISPPYDAFLSMSCEYRAYEELPKEWLRDDTAIIVIDTSAPSRSVRGIEDGVSPATLINIDHHGDNTKFGDVVYVDDKASATSEILWDLAEAGGWRPCIEACIGVYTGIVTDCGHFAYANTTPNAHRVAARLLELGVKPQELDERINSKSSVKELHLWGKAYSRVALIGGGCVAFTWLSDDDFQELGVSRYSTEGLANELVKVNGVDVGMLLTEEGDCVRVSFRAKGKTSVRELAQRFGGGGHPQAAACRLHLSLSEAIDLIKEEVERLYARPFASGR